jgi:hypothetical protein
MRDVKHGELTMGIIRYVKAGGAMARVFRLLAATVGMLAIFEISAESADDLQPPDGYRRLFHVNTMIVDKTSPLFEVLGGICTSIRWGNQRSRKAALIPTAPCS